MWYSILSATWILIPFILLGFILSRVFRRNDIADGLWPLGFLIISFYAWSQAPNPELFKIFIAQFLLVAWALRLSLHLFIRISRHAEDKRYQKWRQQWKGSEALNAFLRVFLLQGIILAFISLPLLVICFQSEAAFTTWDWWASIMIISGILIEAWADLQLSQFRQHQQGHSQPIVRLRTGIWSWCRHPNYLGEILVWWGFAVMAASTGGHYWVFLSPILLTYLLYAVSGVPLQSVSAEDRRPLIIPILLSPLLRFSFIVLVMIFLDSLWLGWAMKEYYARMTADILRIEAGLWQPQYWAIFSVYFFMAIGLKIYVHRSSLSRSECFYRGVVLGLMIYGVYDSTNLAVLREWPTELAIVDLLWGGVLCGLTALVTWRNKNGAHPHPE